jgi:hypothetical protein
MPPVTHAIPVGSQDVPPSSNPSSVTAALAESSPASKAAGVRPIEKIPPTTQAASMSEHADAATGGSGAGGTGAGAGESSTMLASPPSAAPEIVLLLPLASTPLMPLPPEVAPFPPGKVVDAPLHAIMNGQAISAPAVGCRIDRTLPYEAPPATTDGSLRRASAAGYEWVDRCGAGATGYDG